MSNIKALPSHSGPPPGKPIGGNSSTPSPSPTLYLTNLPEKLRKEDLRTALYMLFSTYGVVLDVVAMRGNKMRGQAHIVMRDTAASTQAMRALQDFDFFGKEVKIRYSSNKSGRSHVFNRLEGQWKEAASTEDDAAAAKKKQSAFEAPRPGAEATLTDKAGPGLGGQKKTETDAVPEPQGIKRRREDEEEEEEEDEEAPMDEDDDDDVEMEESDED